MLKEEKTIPGTWYTITCTAPATVTQQIDGETATLATLTESGTTTFRPSASTITVQTDGKYHILPTKAPAAGSSGGSTNLTLADLAELKQSAAEVREAVQTLEGTANVKANNTFSGVNTFNGEVVANDALFYAQQELGDLLSYPVAARLLEAGINPASALARTWNEWVAMNPNWESLGSLLFYAPLMQGVTLPSFTATSTPFTKCTFISPAHVSGTGCSYLLSNNITLYTLKAGSCGDVYNCYDVKKCSFYAPKVTEFDRALNATGYLNSGASLELSVYVPELRVITSRSINTSLYRIGLLKTFSIYAPKLVSSFDFSRDTHGLGGQTCAILHKLIDGIGTPETVQTITTLTPADAENVADLQAAAAAKNWEFVFE